jgi:ATP-binding cassette, subfamily B, bacterial PglK
MKLPFGQVGNVIGLLEPREKRRLALVGVGAIFMGIINVIGVGSIMPFIAVASNPDKIHKNLYFSWAYDFFRCTTDTQFLVLLGVGVLAFLILTNVTNAFLQYIKVRFTSMRRHSLSMRLFKAYLGQRYDFFLNRNSFDFVKNINGEISQMITGTLMQFVEVVTYSIQVFLLIVFLFVVDPRSTLAIAIVIGLVYSFIYQVVRKAIKGLGNERFDLTQGVSRVVSEAFWGIKEVKITGTESVFLGEYAPPSKKMAKNASTSELIGDIPKYALEAVAFSTIMIFVLFTIVREGSFANAATTVTLFAYAAYRLIPAVQSLFKSITKLKYSAPTAERMLKEFALSANAEPLPKKPPSRMPFYRSLELRGIGFTYPTVSHALFEGINLEIKANQLVGFAGKTGSGKTTLVDIILGLLLPQEGQMLADGVPIDQRCLRSWQANLGYVPQNIYLSNDSIAANIAFGVPRGEIDLEAVKKASNMAQIHDFVATELEEGYATLIGERGIRLSGGQRQRIGIARALYRNPSVLIMDEATSALDNLTEQAVMEAMDRLMGKKTIILIAHRLSTLRHCDRIFLLEKGKIVDTGNYRELEARNEHYFKPS